ncbi:MAG: metallophosphoesterase family protein [Candidatus Hodarchaeales archaeon]|jgi:exonuclease SbcD
MAKIVIVGDVHIGIRYAFRVDLKTGLSDRTIDFIDAFARVVSYTIENKMDLILIAGDLYDRIVINPTLLKIVREKIWIPLINAQIPVICVGGNHDSPQIHEKGSPMGEISLIPNSIIARLPQSITVNIPRTDEKIGFLLLPYLTSGQVVKFIEKMKGKKIEREDWLLRSQDYLRIFIENEINNFKTKKIIILGHYFYKGSKINIIPFPDQLPHEFVIKKDMLPLDKIDLAIFGHVHTTQTLNEGKVVIPGSLERVDFGEVNEDKGFYIFDTHDNSLTFKSNNPRKLVRKFVEVPKVNDPTAYLIEKLTGNYDEAIVRILIKINPDLQNRIIIPRIHQLFSTAYHFDLEWNLTTVEHEIVLPELILDPLVLFSDFIKEKYGQDPHFDELRGKGLEILEEAIGKVEEKQ